jgi:ankyrin repeat protein
MSLDFFAAIKAGNMDEVQRLLSRDPGLIHARENGLSPVLVAAYHHQQGIASYIADKTVTLTIFEASAIGRTNQVLILLARDPLLVNAFAEDGFQPLGLACFFGHKDTVEYLLKAGAPVNVYSQNPLHTAPIQSAAAAGQLDIVVMLVQFGAEVNVCEQGGYTPLHAAAQNGDLDMLRFLVLNGADQEAKSDDGKIPLDLALEAEKPEAAKFLKEGITRRFKGRRNPSKIN